MSFSPYASSMPAYRGKIPRLTWGAAFANALNFGYALDEVSSWPAPREGSEFAQTDAGEEDAWVTGFDQILEGTVRWIPRDTGVTPEGRGATGWDDANGWAAFLEWAWGKNVLRFYPDIVNFPAVYVPCYLVKPLGERPAAEDDYSRKLTLQLRTADGSRWVGY